MNILLSAAPQLWYCASIRIIPQCTTCICALESGRITQLKAGGKPGRITQFGKAGAPELIQGKDQDTGP